MRLSSLLISVCTLILPFVSSAAFAQAATTGKFTVRVEDREPSIAYKADVRSLANPNERYRLLREKIGPLPAGEFLFDNIGAPSSWVPLRVSAPAGKKNLSPARKQVNLNVIFPQGVNTVIVYDTDSPNGYAVHLDQIQTDKGCVYHINIEEGEPAIIRIEDKVAP